MINLEKVDLGTLPGMVRWFSPVLLAKTAWRSIVSGVFCQYADQRAMQAAVDIRDPEALIARYNYVDEIARDASGAVWVDFVADVGDGFDSTYAIASLLAKDELDIPGAGRLQAGQVLIMGGDQVYPYPSRDEYRERFHLPYELALPSRPGVSDRERRKLFVMPGNHDWYDGLVSFDYYFCAARQGAKERKEVGGWICPQHRSYFALRLPDNWWIWGPDIQLSRYLDVGQVDYFSKVSTAMTDKDKVILCLAQPSWISAVHDTTEPRLWLEQSNLDRIVELATRNHARIFAMLAGDLHHYCHYRSDLGMSMITAGGGGAYMHPTHNLKRTINVNFNLDHGVVQHQARLDAGEGQGGKLNCDPQPALSRWMAFRNLYFLAKNPLFCAALGIVYWLMGWQFRTTSVGRTSAECPPHKYCEYKVWELIDKTPGNDESMVGIVFSTAVNNFMLAVLGVATLATFYVYADVRGSRKRKLLLGSIHWLAHISAMVAIAFAVSFTTPYAQSFLLGIAAWFPEAFHAFPSGTWNTYQPAVTAIQMWALGSIAGGVIWGVYLALCCGLGKIHCNDAFSAQRIQDYKNFLRLKIEADKLTIYPIGLKRVPNRGSWKKAPTESGSLVVPKKPLRPRLLEDPIEIRAADVKPITQAKV